MTSPLNRVIAALLTAALVFAAAPAFSQPTAAAADRASRPPLPAGWKGEDFEVPSLRLTLEAGRYPNRIMATNLRGTLEGMGWGPIVQTSVGDEEVVFLGNFTSVAHATYASRDIAAQRIHNTKVVEVPHGLSFPTVGIDGPLLAPFTPTNRGDRRLLSRQEAARQLNLLAHDLPDGTSDPARLAFERLAAEPDWSSFGEHAGLVALELQRLKVNAPLAFYLAQRVATGEWSAPDSIRVAAGELAADLLYGWLRDWRGAWASSVALLEDPQRSAAGRARDRLRLAALKVELAASAAELRPTWNRVRLQLRRAWDEVPLQAEREQAKIELVYLQTFAWQGNWGRVEELGKDFVGRHGSRWPHEAGLALIMVARSMERREAYDEAIALLDRHFGDEGLPPGDGLYMGFERLDLEDRYRQARQHLASARRGAGSQRAGTMESD
jgi:hypothetical protein